MNDTLGATIADPRRKEEEKEEEEEAAPLEIRGEFCSGSGEYRGAEEKHQFPPEKNLGDAIP